MPLVDAAAASGSPYSAASWVNDLERFDPVNQRFRRWLVVALCAWVVLVVIAVPFGIGGSWRECDTQAIARNFLVDGFEPLRPRIDWRGTTDGAVECEFPLYQTMVAAVMAIVGEAEWPGRVISMLAMLMATLSLHRLLEARSGGGPALVGALVFLTGGHAFLLGTRVTPDATSTAFALAGLTAFTQFLGSGRGGGRTRTLVLATAMTTAACLTKPTALQIGLLQFLWTACLAPRRLREPRVWLAWVVVLAVVGAWIGHGVHIYDETGLTFGVAAGGETKFPTLRSLRTPEIWLWLFKTTLLYGFSAFGVLGLTWLCVRRRLDRTDTCLLLVVGLGLVGTLRYSHHFGVGPQYHVFAAVAAAYFAARAWPSNARWPVWSLALAVLAAVGATRGTADLPDGGWEHGWARGLVWHVRAEREARLQFLAPWCATNAAEVVALSSPADLAVVHGFRERFDAYWRRRTNYEEPMLLYQARRHGWVLPRDGFTLDELTKLHRQGARIVVDQLPNETPPESKAWLDSNAEVVRDVGGQRIYRLRAST